MFIPIADFWMNGWGDTGEPEEPPEPATATVSSGPVGGATVGVAVLTTSGPNSTVSGAATGDRTLGGQ